MGSRYQHDFTENLEAVARGVRRLEEIADPELRAAIRTALGLGEGDTPGLDAARRARIRRVVLAAALPQRPRPSDRAIGVMTILAAPAPYVVRFLAAVVLAIGVLAGAAVASADSLPDEPLYGLKVASEQLRLALAVAPEDRAAVELSLAEHRLHEAERLAARGSESGAVVAASAYAAHLASAAAELSQVESQGPRTIALVAQLGSSLAQQRVRAADAAQRLVADPSTALAGAVLGTIATTPPAGVGSAVSRIAESASAVSARISAEASDRARSAPAVEDADDDDAAPVAATPRGAGPAVATARAAAGQTSIPARTPERGAAATAGTVAAPGTAGGQPSAATLRPSAAPARPTVDPSARIAAEKASEAAARAKLSAERSRTTPVPKPSTSPRR